MSDKCPLCLQTSIRHGANSKFVVFNCPNCGNFGIDDLEIQHLDGKSSAQKALLSHIIGRGKEQRSEAFKLTKETIAETLENEKLPTVSQKLENLIRVIGDNSPGLGHLLHWKEQDYMKHSAEVGALPAEIFVLAENARIQGLVTGGVETIEQIGQSNREVICPSFELSFYGHQRYEEITHGRGEANEAFMAMPFGNDDLNKAFKEYWKPAADKADFVLERVDERPTAGPIDDRIRNKIRRAKFMICDLTGGNHGAYWEAGFAEGVGVPVIYLFKEASGHDPHFDINHHLYIKWNDENIAEQAELLTAVIQETMAQKG